MADLPRIKTNHFINMYVIYRIYIYITLVMLLFLLLTFFAQKKSMERKKLCLKNICDEDVKKM